MNIETMKLAFEKMTGIPDAWTNPALMQTRNGFIQGWEAAIEQAKKQEPVVWGDNVQGIGFKEPMPNANYRVTATIVPPQHKWQGLTDEEKAEIQMLKWWNWEDFFDLDGYTRAIEAKLKEKNNANR